MTKSGTSLGAFVAKTLGGPVHPEAKAFAKTLADEFPGTKAVLYYGSCLRTDTIKGLILDFYVIVDNYREAHGNALTAFFNHLVPPNVYYREINFKGEAVRAKVAVVSMADFIRRASGEVLNVSIWARFAQPARLAFAGNAEAKKEIEAAVKAAILVMVSKTLPLVGERPSPKDLWVTGLTVTYGAEFRSERRDKAEELFRLNKDYFEAITPLALAEIDRTALKTGRQERRAWVFRRLNGKFVSLMRLVKAVFTFQGGIDYLAWKIERSSGVKIEIKPWQRRFPLIAGVVLFFKLRLKGAFR